MKDHPQKGKGKVKLSRRDFLKAGAAGLGVAALGGLPEKVFGQAPAFKKGTSLSILQGSYFIAPSQDLYKRQAQEWGRANGVTMSADFLNWPDLQPKIAASVQAGGYDIVDDTNAFTVSDSLSGGGGAAKRLSCAQLKWKTRME